MPLGGPFLTNGELAFIQEWIYAGVPETGAVVDEALLLDETVWESPPFEPLDIPENGVQFHLGPFEIWDGFFLGGVLLPNYSSSSRNRMNLSC